jgi:hypothetical protein
VTLGDNLRCPLPAWRSTLIVVTKGSWRMNISCCEGFSACVRGNRQRVRTFLGSLLLAVSWSITWSFAPEVVCGQTENEGNSLPATTGEALTITPVDMPDVDCVVQRWKGDGAKPVLTLLCPPAQVFAPLRVLIKLSWMKPEDAPVNPIDILALPGAATKIRTCKAAAFVWLQVRKKEGGQSRSVWVSFTGVVDVALLGGQSRKHSS